MVTASTLTNDDLEWEQSGGEAQPELLHVVIGWSHAEPDRICEAAPIESMRILGRGEALPEDPSPRVTFYRQRPRGTTARPPLHGPRISRVQLELAPAPDGALAVRSVGRCALLINGEQTSSGLAKPG